MALSNFYKPRNFFSNRTQSKIYTYKDGYLRRFYERRGRRAKRGGLFRRYVLVANNRKWTIARRFIRPIRRWTRIRTKRSRSTINGRPIKRLYKNAFFHKQRLRHYYGNNKEQIFRTFFQSYKRIQGTNTASFFSILESRLDRSLYRRRLFPTLYGCRQFINYHGVFVNNRVEKSAPFQVKIGDTLSLPVFAWRSLYWDLYCRVYYRRWGRYISTRRFYSRFHKKIFKARWYFLRNRGKGYGFRKNRDRVTSKNFTKSTSLSKKLWFNFISPFSVAKSLQFFKSTSENFFFRNDKQSVRDLSHQSYHIHNSAYAPSRRGFLLLRPVKNVSSFYAQNTLSTKRKKLIFRSKRKNFIKKTKVNTRTSKLVQNDFNLGKITSISNKKITKYRVKNIRRFVTYLKKKYTKIKSKKKNSIASSKVKYPTLFSKKHFSNYLTVKQRFASRIHNSFRARRLFRRSFNGTEFFKNFAGSSKNKDILNKETNQLENSENHLFYQKRYGQIFKEVPRTNEHYLRTIHLNYFRKLLSTETWNGEDISQHRKKRTDTASLFVEAPTTLYHRKRNKLSTYFFIRKLRKKLFPFFTDLFPDTFNDISKNKINTPIVAENKVKNKSTIRTVRVNVRNKWSKNYRGNRAPIFRKQSFVRLKRLPIYYSGLLARARLRNSIGSKFSSKYQQNSYRLRKPRLIASLKKKKILKHAFKHNTATFTEFSSKRWHKAKRDISKKAQRGYLFKKDIIKTKINGVKRNSYRKTAVNISVQKAKRLQTLRRLRTKARKTALSLKELVQRDNLERIEFREQRQQEKGTSMNRRKNRFERKFIRNPYRKYGKLRYKQKRVRFIRRKLARFFRRRRYRIRRRRAFPRLKPVHRYFPAYVQNDLRTLRTRKMSNPRTTQIFTGFRLSPAKMYAFYKSRGF